MAQHKGALGALKGAQHAANKRVCCLLSVCSRSERCVSTSKRAGPCVVSREVCHHTHTDLYMCTGVEVCHHVLTKVLHERCVPTPSRAVCFHILSPVHCLHNAG